MSQIMNLTQDEVLELVNSNKRLHIKLANAVVENKLLLEQLQEKSQGAAIYEIDYNSENIWQAVHSDLYPQLKDKYPSRIVYLQPQSVKDVLEKAAKEIEVFALDAKSSMAKAAYYSSITTIRALVDQPAEQPTQSHELLDYVDRLEWRLIESNKILEKEGIYSTNTFLNKKTLASKPTKG